MHLKWCWKHRERICIDHANAFRTNRIWQLRKSSLCWMHHAECDLKYRYTSRYGWGSFCFLLVKSWWENVDSVDLWLSLALWAIPWSFVPTLHLTAAFTGSSTASSCSYPPCSADSSSQTAVLLNVFFLRAGSNPVSSASAFGVRLTLTKTALFFSPWALGQLSNGGILSIPWYEF